MKTAAFECILWSLFSFLPWEWHNTASNWPRQFCCIVYRKINYLHTNWQLALYNLWRCQNVL